MRYFRHAPMMLWSGLCLAGVVVFALALATGGDGLHQRPLRNQAVQTSAVAALRERTRWLVEIGSSPDGRIDTWAAGTRPIVKRALAERSASAGSQDALSRAWLATLTDIDAVVAADRHDPAAVNDAVDRFAARSDELAFLVAPGASDWSPGPTLSGGVSTTPATAPSTTVAPVVSPGLGAHMAGTPADPGAVTPGR